MEHTPKILIYDIEVSPILIWAFSEWDANALKVEQYSFMFCFSYKWYGEKDIRNVSLIDFPVRYKSDPTDDKDVVIELHRLMSEADIVVAHNANRFDNRVAMARFVVHELGPPAPYKTVDTLQVARRYTKFSSNALDKLAQQLNIGRKTLKRYGDLWYGCYTGNMVKWRDMIKYNNMDVRVLERMYKRYLPYITNHPNLSVISQKPHTCTNCGGIHIIRKGYRTTNRLVYARYKCTTCGHWMSDRLAEKDTEKPDFVNFNG